MESRKMVLKNIFARQQWRHRYREQTYGQGWGRGGEGEMNGESIMEAYTLPHVKQRAYGNFLYNSGTSDGSSVTT